MSTAPMICEAIAAILKAPRTRRDLEQYLHVKSGAAWGVIAVLHRSGLIYVAERRHRPRDSDGKATRGPRIPVYGFQPTPFEKPDVPPIKRTGGRHARN